MPELPEVETVRRILAVQLVGRSVARCRVLEPRLRWPLSTRFEGAMRGVKFAELRRRGKYILADIERAAAPPTVLAVHLGMTGWWGLRHGSRRPHDHVEWRLDDGQRLVFNDPRRFGSLHLFDRTEEASHPRLARLGVEPLMVDAFTADFLLQRCRGRSTTIKERLMDAQMVVGVGNIYASEALFAARIHPMLPAERLDATGAERLVAAVRATLLAAIECGGTTFRDFRGSDGELGRFIERLRVYARSGAGCTACQSTISKSTIGGRSTYFCPGCQVLPRRRRRPARSQ